MQKINSRLVCLIDCSSVVLVETNDGTAATLVLV